MSQALIPGSPLTKDVFGGVLFAQSVAAAEATVGDNFGTNAAQSFFIRKGLKIINLLNENKV